jgi:hypothetical protein
VVLIELSNGALLQARVGIAELLQRAVLIEPGRETSGANLLH